MEEKEAEDEKIGVRVIAKGYAKTSKCARINLTAEKSFSSPIGFEPMRGNPNGFQVHRLNHSATTTYNFITENYLSVSIEDFVTSEKMYVADRIRTYAGKSQWISSPSP